MSVLKSLHATSEKAIEKGEEFLKNSEEYYKLKIFQVLTSSLSMIFNFAIIGIFILIAFIFLAVALSMAINSYFDHKISGHIVVALLFLCFALVSYFSRNRMENLVIKSLSKKYFDDEESL
ncbi:hypothetical protein [Tenacibaculum piscium]|uniref:Competence protein n=1 Tax=Tenacibaculum piscium TaxID=1458515 RepID=A0A2H1YFG7_9FLAO|nr:hypothetical protein [Tenacibaculum piscium]MBE7629079.1 hypothetical protein [Tenacibaculum piscium]MBE7670522.1 hypothetical protein [Tenacibaculum piscium]MBE7684900.1 hypothetical protein [Tenacibaculum piscium]MBE7689603.1 hypothetical protein [Tenacibaculum piscium]MCG8183469.1 hypothetical protein [Tenacibaculum piscium]